MTSMPHLAAAAGSPDDAAAELANLRAAYRAACDELMEVRRQRDEAVTHGQELLARLVEADEKLARMSEPHPSLFAVEPVAVVSAPVEPVEPVEAVEAVERPEPIETEADTEPIRVAPVQAAPEPVSPIPTIVGAPPVEAPVLVEAVVEAPDAPEPVRWLPPEEGAVTHSTAHEFAALKELPDEVEADDDPAGAGEPLTSPMNVLPEVSAPAKPSIWRRKIL